MQTQTPQPNNPTSPTIIPALYIVIPEESLPPRSRGGIHPSEKVTHNPATHPSPHLPSFRPPSRNPSPGARPLVLSIPKLAPSPSRGMSGGGPASSIRLVRLPHPHPHSLYRHSRGVGNPSLRNNHPYLCTSPRLHSFPLQASFNQTSYEFNQRLIKVQSKFNQIPAPFVLSCQS